ncbi:MAG: M81 family metallopeptidase [Alphaproteobacteria bacterium]|nr:M81 family metallopeptidase [Alphaproteobacteria bacterium]
MRIFTACLGTETNTFAPMPTGRRLFEETCFIEGGTKGKPPSLFAQPMVVAREEAEKRGWQAVEGLCAFATPAGITVRKVYEELRDRILGELKAAMPVNMVMMSLHGAMVADGYDDCEGDLLTRIRAMVGPKVAVGAELDLHCHLTNAMVAACDVIVTFKEYPHTDVKERAHELFCILADRVEGKVKPRMALFDCRMLGIYHPTREPIKSFVEEIKALEGKNGVLSVSFGHGFPWGDVPDASSRILVVTDNRPEDAKALAERLGRKLYAMRETTQPPYLSIGQALDRAIASNVAPIVLADCSDNSGGGAASDSTYFLAEILRRGGPPTAIGWFWDPGAVDLAFEAGEGAKLRLRLGGKVSALSGQPLDLDVTVVGLKRAMTQPFGGGIGHLGDAAALRTGEVDIVVNRKRTQVFSPNPFEAFGIDLARKKLVVVKSMQHFHAGYAPIAKDILYVATPGTVSPDFHSLPYRKLARPIWPLDPAPLG